MTTINFDEPLETDAPNPMSAHRCPGMDMEGLKCVVLNSGRVLWADDDGCLFLPLIENREVPVPGSIRNTPKPKRTWDVWVTACMYDDVLVFFATQERPAKPELNTVAVQKLTLTEGEGLS